MSTDSYERTERGARLVGAGIIVSRLLGLVRGKLVSLVFGTGMDIEAYQAASRIPNALRNLLGEGAISASFVPVYAAALERGDEKGANALASALLGVLLAGISILTLIGIALAPVLTWAFAHGFTGEKAELTTRLMRVLFPMTGLMVISGWCLGVQNAHRRFFMSYASGAMWSIAQIAMLLIGRMFEHDLTVLVWWLSWATLGGSLLQIAAQLPQVLRLVKPLRPTLDMHAPGLRGTLVNFGPVVGALGIVQISGLIDLFIASLLPDGAVASLTAANQIYILPLSLFGVATVAAALPQMARDSARGDVAAVGPGLARAWERVLFYTIPSAIAFIAIGDAIVALLNEGGKFTPEDRVRVQVILATYALGLVTYASARLLASSYQATRNYRRPFTAAIWSMLVSAAVGSAIALSFRDRPIAVAGLAAGGVVGAHVNLTMLWRGLRAQLGAVDFSGPASVARRTLAASALAALPSIGVRLMMRNAPIHLTSVLVIVIFCVAFLAAAKQLKLDEAGRVFSLVTRGRIAR